MNAPAAPSPDVRDTGEPFLIGQLGKLQASVKVSVGRKLGKGALGIVRELNVVGERPLFLGKSNFIIKSVIREPNYSMLVREILVHLVASNMVQRDECDPQIMCFRGVIVPRLSPDKLTGSEAFLNLVNPLLPRIGKDRVLELMFVTDANIGPHPHMIYERVMGPTLHDLLYPDPESKRRPVNFRELGLSLLQAVKTLHDKNIVHRDIKPENIMLQNDELKLIDLGLSCLLLEGKRNMACRVGEGTFQFIGPEAFESSPRYVKDDQPVSERLANFKQLDLFAIGATLYELLVQQSIHGTSFELRDILAWLSPGEAGPRELVLVWQDDETRPFQELVTRMVRYDAAERPSLEEAIAAWTAAMALPVPAPLANAPLASSSAPPSIVQAAAAAAAAATPPDEASEAAKAEGGRRLRATRRPRTKKRRSRHRRTRHRKTWN